MSIAVSNASGSRSAAMSVSARSRSCGFLLRCTAVIRKRLFSSPRAVEVQHRARPAPAVGRHARAGQRRPHVLLAVVEVLDGDPPQLALEDLEAPLLLGAHRQHAPLHAHPPPAPAAHRPDDDRPAAVDVAVEQRVQRHDRVVVLGRGVHEVDHQPRLLAGMAAGDAPDALLVDALGGRRRQVHADRRARAVPALGQQLRVDQHVDVAALVAREDLRQLALGRLAGDPLRLDAFGAEGLGEVVGVLHARRVHDAGHAVEARLVEVRGRHVERLLVEQLRPAPPGRTRCRPRRGAAAPWRSCARPRRGRCARSAAARSRRAARPGRGRSARSAWGTGR